jgi:hypothetical protein
MLVLALRPEASNLHLEEDGMPKIGCAVSPASLVLWWNTEQRCQYLILTGKSP